MIAAVKRFMAYSLLLLVPAMVGTGISGNSLGGRGGAKPILVKRRRTKFIAANGLLVLVPCALVLHVLASHGSFGPTFYLVQAVELIAGPVNVVLLSLNVRDGLRPGAEAKGPEEGITNIDALMYAP